MQMFLALSQCCSLTFIQLEITSDKRKLVGWCNDNHLLLNVSKTKEIVVDFRRDPRLFAHWDRRGIQVGDRRGLQVGLVSECLGPPEKGQPAATSVKKLKSFSVCPKLLELFYMSTVESVVTFNSLCHFGGLKEQDKARLSKITAAKTASRLIGRPVPDLQALFEAKAVKRLEAIHRDPTHPLCTELQAHTSARSGRLISFRAKTSRFHSQSFLPASVRLCNAEWSCDLGQTYCWQDSCSLMLYHWPFCFYHLCLFLHVLFKLK